MGLYWVAAGWIVVLLVVDVVAVTLAILTVQHFSGGHRAMLQHPYFLLGVTIANYLALALCASVVTRIYLMHGLWERVVTSTTVHNVDRADDVRALGAPVSAPG